MRVVAKFGGTSLGNGDRVNRAADSIAAAVEAGHEVTVVASAMGSTTDFLLDAISFDAEQADRAEIVSMGERTAVRNQPGVLSDLSAPLAEADINIDAVSSGMDSITFYLDAARAEEAETILHDAVVTEEVLSSVTVDDDLAVVRVTGDGLPTEPGTIYRALTPLAENRLTIHDVISSGTSVGVFVDWDEREEALELIQSVEF